jgi:hypothetical protein
MTHAEHAHITDLVSTATGPGLQIAGFAAGYGLGYLRTRNAAISSVVGLSLPGALGAVTYWWASVLLLKQQGIFAAIFFLIPIALFPGLIAGTLIFFFFALPALVEGEMCEDGHDLKRYALATTLLMLNVGVVAMGWGMASAPPD